LLSTRGVACSAVSNGSAGNDLSRSISRESASPTVFRRPRIVSRRSVDVRRREPVVELGQHGDLWDRHQVGAAEAAHIALHAALLVRAFLARAREARLGEMCERSATNRSDSTRRRPLSTFTTADPRLSYLTRPKAPPNHSNAATCPSKKRLLGLAHMRLHEARPEKHARITRPHQEQKHPRRDAGDQHGRLAPVDLRLRARLAAERHEHLVDQFPERPTALTHVPPDLSLRDLDAVLVPQPLPHPLGRVALLARRPPVGLKPRVDQLTLRAQFRRRPPLRTLPRRRQWRLQRRPDRPAMHTVPRASASTDSPPRSWSRRICSNSSTLDPIPSPDLL
jgi:hypothetical protein